MRERSHPQRLAVLERDAAVARAGRVRRWAIAGTAALTAGFAGLVAAIAPGKSLGAKHSTLPPGRTSTAASSPATPMPPLESPSQLGLQGPDQAPQAAPPSSAPSTPGPPAAQPAEPAPATPSPQDAGGPVSGGS